MKKIFFVFFFTSVSLHAFDRPESVLLVNNNLYVSNMSGPGWVKDGKGWISVMNKKGKVLLNKWIDGLNAPKGLGVHGGLMFTTDIDELVVIDIAKSKVIKKIPVPGSKLLNDIAVDPSGNLYVSDTFGSKLFFIEIKTYLVKELATLQDAPNGLMLEGDVLYIAGFGKAKADGSGMEDGVKGGLWSFDLKTKEVKSVLPQLGKVDGILRVKDGRVVISVKGDEALYWIDLNAGKVTGTLDKGAAKFTDVADLGYDPEANMLYVPNTNSHDVQMVPVN